MNKRTLPLENQEIFTFKEGCAYLRIGTTLGRKLLKERRLTYCKLPNGDVRLRKQDLDTFLQNGKVEAFDVQEAITSLLRGKRKASLKH